MSEIIHNITTVIAPIFLVAGAAALLDRTIEIDPRSLSRLILYLLAPCLVLDGIAHAQLRAGEAAQLVAVALVGSILVALAAAAVARFARFDRRLGSAFVLSATLINAGNYGIPLNTFAFGAEGEERALIFFTTTVVVANTLGIYLASLGTLSTRRALLNVAKVPLPYAAVLGVLLNAGDISMPLPVDRAVKLLAQAATPAMLVVLGVQLSRASVGGRWRPILLASGIRLVGAPLIALALAVALGISGLTRQVSIVQSAMPTAVFSGVLAVEFGNDSDFVTAVILVSTVLSILTLSVLLSLLM